MRFRDWLKELIGGKTSGATDSLREEMETDEVDPFNPFPEPVEIEIKDIIDLHTIPPRDVQAVVQEYLHQAYAKRFRYVRIIHGKGIGVQREIVRNVLSTTTFVIDWNDAPPEAGGLGATIVRLRESPLATDSRR